MFRGELCTLCQELIASFLEHFKGKSWKYLKLIFQFHISKFKIFHTLFYWLSIWIYRKWVIDHKNSPREILENILIVLIRLIFLFSSFLALFCERNFSINHGNKTRKIILKLIMSRIWCLVSFHFSHVCIGFS